MPKPTKGPRIGGSPAHQRIILANLASQLFEHGRIITTETRAKRVQPLAEHLITKAKRGDIAARRIVAKTITSRDVLHTLFTDIAPKLAGRDGGYTRVTKLGIRKGDGAPIAQIEIIEEAVVKKAKASKKAAPVAEPVTTAVDVDDALAQAEAAAGEIEADDAADVEDVTEAVEEAADVDDAAAEDAVAEAVEDAPADKA